MLILMILNEGTSKRMKVIAAALSSHSGVITARQSLITLPRQVVGNVIQLRENRRAPQVQVIDSVFEKMNEILDRYYDTNPKIESEEHECAMA